MRMIAMEATEAERREEEIRRRIEGLDEQKRKNRSANQAGSEEVSNLSGLNVNTVEPACMVHGCKVNPLIWSIFGQSRTDWESCYRGYQIL